MSTTAGKQAGRDFDQTLFEFMCACPAPSPEDVERWCAVHPEVSGEIRACAATMAAMPPDDVEEDDVLADPSLAAILERTRARLDAMAPERRRRPLAALLQDRGAGTRELAADIGFDDALLAQIASGRLAPPALPRLVAALASALGATEGEVREAIAESFDRSAPSDGLPPSWEEAVEASGMAAERKRRWLGEPT